MPTKIKMLSLILYKNNNRCYTKGSVPQIEVAPREGFFGHSPDREAVRKHYKEDRLSIFALTSSQRYPLVRDCLPLLRKAFRRGLFLFFDKKRPHRQMWSFLLKRSPPRISLFTICLLLAYTYSLSLYLPRNSASILRPFAGVSQFLLGSGDPK